MCGLIGIATIKKDLSVLQLRKWIETATVISTLRGKDSTGIAVVGAADSMPAIFKDTIPGWTFVETRKFGSILPAKAALAYMIHTRSATVGGVDYDTAHPFVEGPITMEHNGTLTSMNHYGVAVSDSEWICQQLAATSTPAQVLSELEGAYALVWHDIRDGALRLARNDERPLYYSLSRDEQVLTWASEEWMLASCLSRSNLLIDMLPPRELPVGNIHKFNLTPADGKLRPRITPFTPRQPRTYYSQNNYRNYTHPPVSPPNNNTRLTVVSPSLPKEIDQSKPLVFIADEAVIHKNGTVHIMGPVMNETEEYIEAGCILRSQKEWHKYKGVKDPVFEGNIATWRNDYYGKDRTETNRYLHVALSNYKFLGPYAKYLKKQPKNNPDQADIPGPGGLMITEATFKEITIDGCVSCQAPLSARDAVRGTIIWTLDQLPLCKNCTHSANTHASYGNPALPS